MPALYFSKLGVTSIIWGKQKMNITFFIGNGFDINLGLKTRYSDFYPYFVNKSTESNMIKAWLTKDELLWADLEEQLGKKICDVEESQKEKFYEDKAELDELLLEYLEQEQEKILTQNCEKKIADEFARSLMTFYSNLSEADRASIASTCNLYRSEEFKYCFICFNYTNALDQIVNITRRLRSPITTHPGNGSARNNSLDKVLHIHGTLNEEMILGVNDINQVNNNFFKNDEEFLDTFIKRRMNDGIGQRKTEHAKELIEDSHIICIFGMSIGNTDKMWWEEIVHWLKKSEYNKLIIFYKGYSDELNKKLPAKTIRLNNRLKRKLLEKGGMDINDPDIEKVKRKIFISYNANIFNFKEMGLVVPF